MKIGAQGKQFTAAAVKYKNIREPLKCDNIKGSLISYNENYFSTEV